MQPCFNLLNNRFINNISMISLINCNNRKSIDSLIEIIFKTLLFIFLNERCLIRTKSLNRHDFRRNALSPFFNFFLRTLGLVVCRGPAVTLVCPNDSIEQIENPFLQPPVGEGAHNWTHLFILVHQTNFCFTPFLLFDMHFKRIHQFFILKSIQLQLNTYYLRDSSHEDNMNKS